MKLNTIFCLLFFLIFINCNQNKSYSIDSYSNNKDSVLLKEYLNLTNFYIEKNNNDSSKFFTSKLLQLAHTNNNHYYLGKANSTFGYFNLIEKKDDSAYFYFNKAKESFLKINDSINIGKNIGNMAIIQSQSGDYSGGEITAIKALNYLNNKLDISFIPSIYNAIAISSRRQSNYSEAIYWYNKAIEFATDSLNKKIYTNNIAVSYNYLGKYQKTDSILSVLLKDSTVINNKDLKSKVIDNLAYTKWKKNPTRNLENEFQKALKIREENNDNWGQIASHSHLSEYFNKRNSGKSLFHAQKMYNIATKLNSPDDRLEALQKLISLESPENAKQYAITYTYLSDSLVTARNRAKDQFAKIRYDSEKNREENQLLKIQDAEKQVQLERQKNIKIIFLTGVIMLAFGFITFYLNQRNRIKRERLVATYESEVRMSKKIHDVLSNDIYRFILRLQNLLPATALEKENLIVEIENIYETSRQISKDLHDFETNNFNNEIKSLLESYQSDSVKVIYNLFEDDTWNQVDTHSKRELFRVLQELMTNMSKHSKATHVLIRFKKEKNIIEIIYRDNGVGITDNQSITKSGLTNTENRMESINGSIIFESNNGKGLTAVITFPA